MEPPVTYQAMKLTIDIRVIGSQLRRLHPQRVPPVGDNVKWMSISSVRRKIQHVRLPDESGAGRPASLAAA